MHFMEDTEQEDAVGEFFWKEDYKKILKERLPKAILLETTEDPGFKRVYEELYGDTFSSFEAFNRIVSSIIEIGCENGADDAFDDVYLAFKAHHPLPRDTKICYGTTGLQFLRER
jgi:hypothetical protein